MKNLILILALILPLASFAVPWSIPNNEMKFGNATSVSDKQLIFNQGLGGGNASLTAESAGNFLFNKALTVAGNLVATGTAAFQDNSIAVGDSSTTTDKFIYAETGEVNRPYLGYDKASNAWVISNNGSATSTIPTTSSSLGSRSGCEANRFATSTIRISPCILEVNGSLVNTSTSTDAVIPVGFHATQPVYLYAQDGSTGPTIIPVFSTTAPVNGLRPGSNDKALSRQFFNGDLGIEEHSVDTHGATGFICREASGEGVTILTAEGTDPTKPTNMNIDKASWSRRCEFIHFNVEFNYTDSTGFASGTNNYFFHLIEPGHWFATNVPNAAPWEQTANYGGGVDAFWAVKGNFKCIDETDSTGGLGGIVVYDYTRFRMLYYQTATGTEHAFGTVSGPCTLNANGKSVTVEFQVKNGPWSYGQ